MAKAFLIRLDLPGVEVRPGDVVAVPVDDRISRPAVGARVILYRYVPGDVRFESAGTLVRSTLDEGAQLFLLKEVRSLPAWATLSELAPTLRTMPPIRPPRELIRHRGYLDSRDAEVISSGEPNWPRTVYVRLLSALPASWRAPVHDAAHLEHVLRSARRGGRVEAPPPAGVPADVGVGGAVTWLGAGAVGAALRRDCRTFFLISS